MTTQSPPGTSKRGPAPAAGPMRMMGGQPTEKSMDFKGSGKRMLGLMRPDRVGMYAVLALGVISTALNVVGPKLMGRATDLIFAGVIGRQMQGGTTKAEAVARLRQQGHGTLADMLGSTDFTPGHGIDFGAVGAVLLAVLAVYALGGLFGVFQGRLATKVIQRTVFRLRGDVEEKLARLPLSYFDRQARGEVLSRATNDIDNVAQTMQQTMTQITNSLLMIVGILVMMFWISPLLALIALVTVPVSVVVATAVGKRAQPQFVKQWRITGKLNAHIEEMYTGHALVKVFGRAEESATAFREQNEALYRSGFRA
ncbi:MAG: ATP-binding cassette, subfamily multidrug efflux pump, partial [Streptomycetaceae bacterium]|nr:ATP-binding cassette, subfamily multidrug efflux pump [Streptomycetaceae bacterium]